MSHEGCRHEFEQWKAMVRSCYVETDKRYSKIGLRGIGVCQPWKESFERFLQDMGHAPEGAILRRRDVNGSFRPDNVFWGAINGGDS